MPRLGSPSLWVVLLMVAVCAIAAGSFWWLCTQDDDIPFLSERKPAEWIIYPVPISLQPHPVLQLDTVFRRRFSLKAAPGGALLQLRAFRSCTVKINGQRVGMPDDESSSWKAVRRVEAAKYLKVGENEITATVSSDSGHPALWLSLSGQGWSVNTDTQWQASLAGATWQAARPASQVPGHSMLALTGDVNGPQAKGSVAALAANWAALAVFAGLGAVGVLVVFRWTRGKAMAPKRGGETLTPRRAAAVVVVLAILWVVLFWNNIGLLPPQMGFDVSGHAEYIQQIIDKGRLPLAEDGWQGYQPPLFYLVAAGLMWAGDVSPLADDGVRCLRLMTMTFGIAQLVLVLGCLRLLFPGEHRKQLVGLLVAAFLPMHLYVFHYVTNEGLAALLATGTLYLCLRILRDPDASWRWYAALGACLGAALLAKFSTALLVPVVLTVLAGKLIASDRKRPVVWLRTLGLAALSCLVVCGWHFGRVWYHYGRPLVGNWDPEFGRPWWQDPGFRTAGYYLSFGRSLSQPLFSAFYSFADAMYSTLWGDGWGGGATDLRFGPPWNWELMSAGYLLAIVPSVAIVVGLVAAVVRLVRRPTAQWFLMLGLGVLTLLALVYTTMKLAAQQSQAKAFYGMVAVVPLVALAAWGFDLVARRGGKLRAALWTLLILWCINSYASFWIRDGAAETHLTYGVNLADHGRPAEAKEHLREVLRISPENADAIYGLARSCVLLQQVGEAELHYKAALRANPRHAEAHLGLALLHWHYARPEEAMREVLLAIELMPDHVQARQFLALLSHNRGDREETIDALREVLRLQPQDAGTHHALAQLYVKTKQSPEADLHFAMAIRCGEASAIILERVGRHQAATAARRMIEQWETERAKASRLRPPLQPNGYESP